MQQLYVLQPPIEFLMQVIVSRLPGKASRRKFIYLGVLTTIVGLHRRGDVATVTSIASEFSCDITSVSGFVSDLVKAGILQRTRIKNKTGRGRAYAIEFVENAELREALGLKPNYVFPREFDTIDQG